HTRLIAYIVAHPGQHPNTTTLRNDLQNELPDYLLPTTIITLDELPLTPNGKLDRDALPKPDHNRPELQHPYSPPNTPTEHHLATIWQDILGLDHIGRHDNFFELGGHSLLATQVVSRIRDAFSAEVSLHALFAGPTIAQLGACVAAAKATAGSDPDPPLEAAARACFAATLDADGRLRLPPQLRDRLTELAS
ncbi:MAG TPA: phosphopantetheine-binding protein, partial [Solirubrobacteraceae bacterium]|nr:phosphopantetheine-binding protein [Solirubrobacteraceae bacterium]